MKALLSWKRGYQSSTNKVKRVGQYIYILCPFHKETDPSCLIDYEHNRFHCFGCGKSGKLSQLKVKLPEVTVASTPKTADLQQIYNSVKGLKGAAVEFLKEKGISINIAKEFGVRGDETQIVVPLYVSDILEGVLIRTFPKKYRYYGRKRLLLKGGRDVVVFVESIWSAMKLYQNGISVACTFGVNISPMQVSDIKAAHIKKMYVAFDKDPAGEAGAAELVRLFPQARVIPFPEGVRDAEDAVKAIKHTLRRQDEKAGKKQQSKKHPFRG